MKRNIEEEEIRWDRFLQIKTTGRDDSNAGQFNYPYEPTPFSVLERLANTGYIRKKNLLIDYGCGKGRVGLFLAYQTGIRSIGVEYDERIYEDAKNNLNTAISANKVEFVHGTAQDYVVPATADRFFFFNPFSKEILQKVIENIRTSLAESPREVLFCFYYPSDDYLKLLESEGLELVESVSCRDIFDENDEREQIAIYRL